MIVRSAITCDTCGKLHVVRIGMGQEAHQSHRFPCRGCGEEIGVGLDVDYVNISHRTVTEANCKFSEELPGAEIVNLDSNFVIPSDQQGKDSVFPRIQHMKSIIMKARADGIPLSGIHIDDPRISQRPFRRPDFAQEWSELGKAWKLQRRNQQILSESLLKKASETLYADDPLNDLPDWIWRFCLHLTAKNFHARLFTMMNKIKAISNLDNFEEMIAYYSNNLAPKRGRRYISIFSDYFSSYSEFSQVQFLLSEGIRPSDNEQVSSTNFEATKMFYGNAFEVIADSMDIIAFFNNLTQGRRFDAFSKLTLDEYYKIDKAGRANCFSGDPEFSLIRREFDNQIRNASHHGGMDFDQATQIISYRAGKGGTGPETHLTYTAYLVRCVDIFMQIVCLLQIELLLSQIKKCKSPI